MSPDNGRGRPGRSGLETPEKKSSEASITVDSRSGFTYTPDEVADERHAAYLAGFEAGQREANRVAAAAIAQELLQERANEMLGLARREALAKGPEWAALVEDGAL